jgi:hypothetical protein
MDAQCLKCFVRSDYTNRCRLTSAMGWWYRKFTGTKLYYCRYIPTVAKLIAIQIYNLWERGTNNPLHSVMYSLQPNTFPRIVIHYTEVLQASRHTPVISYKDNSYGVTFQFPIKYGLYWVDNNRTLKLHVYRNSKSNEGGKWRQMHFVHSTSRFTAGNNSRRGNASEQP